MKTSKIKLFLVCSGLGQIQRGFETFTQECFDALNGEPSLDISLFKGGGAGSNNVKRLWNLSRFGWVARKLAYVVERDPYWIEQATFISSLLPHIIYEQPDIIYFSDGSMGNLLWHWRRLTGQKYKILFSNGGQSCPPLLPRCDHIHQITPYYLNVAVEGGTPITLQNMIPYGVNITAHIELMSHDDRKKLRCSLRLPENSSIILSVGAINYQKRMDYVIREVAQLPQPRPFLLLLGQRENESNELIKLGNQLLGSERFEVRTVSSSDMPKYYKVVDAFVLASLSEGFGRVFLEAMAYGLPCMAHDYEVSRFVLGDEGYYANFQENGNLYQLLSTILLEAESERKRHTRHWSIYERFSWEKLRPAYIEMIQSVFHQQIVSRQ